MRKFIKRLGLLIAASFFIVILYLCAALIGGIIPSPDKHKINASGQSENPVYLTANAMHTDIAIPINALTLAQFSFLRKAGFPLDNPNLKFLVVGWGSREFYTSTANYSDMRLATIWRASTGDRSVMHIAPAGDISTSNNAVKVTMSDAGFLAMIKFIMESFKTNGDDPILVPDASFGYGDLFYEANGQFNIFNPCNIWVSKALRKAGVSSGIWTPTTYSLLLHHKLYN